MLRPSIGADASSRFRQVAALGAGSYGVVYEAVDTRTGQRVAIKELNRIDAGSLSRFKQEFRTLQNIHHPNLVGLKELIEEEQRWLIVMDLVEGLDFLKYVRPEGIGCDEGRLRRALLGVTHGLVALHDCGILHRDLKPGNVQVTQDGRAVLLDFGLAIDLFAHAPVDEAVVGTVAYMAPEQAARGSIGPPADFYALGVCLFEALTGEWPFDRGTSFDVLANKQTEVAPRASSRTPRVPADLDDLCAGLLERDPDKRPTAAEVLHVLGGSIDDVARTRTQLTSSLPVAPHFAGRDAELAQLERALARTHAAELRLVLVEGESGVGKSELVSEFVRRLRENETDVVALHGRCYENEQVSYKAFDGGIDDLSRYLRSLPEQECAALLPMRAAVLGQLFPVLSHVGAISRAPLANLSAEPAARRLEAFDALVALLRKLAEEHTLLLLIDDLQWADSESFRLLHAILDHPEPPAMLLVATLRPRAELMPEVLAQVESLWRYQETDIVQLVGLPPAQAELLTGRLLGPQVPREWLGMIARESEGHPLFLGELVQFARSHDFAARGSITLEDALRARIDRLRERERALLEVVALAGRPHGAHIFSRALSLPSIDEPARNLLAAKLLRLRAGRELGCYHDRIRHAAVALIAQHRLPALHRRLALSLAEDPHADASEQARHWDLAGEVDRALLAYRSAAKSAQTSLAFLRAAELSASAMQLLDDRQDPRFHEFGVMRAHALSCAGRNAEAAVLYQQAADRASGETRLQLRSRVATQLLLSSDIKRGSEVAHALLREVGVRLPLSPLGTAWFLLVHRTMIALIGVDGSRRLFKPTERARFAYDLVQQLAAPMSVLYPAVSLLLSTKQSLLAARLRLRSGIAESYSVLGTFACFGNKKPLGDIYFAKSRAMCEGLHDPVLAARQAYLEGSGRIAALDWNEGIACLERAHALLQAHSPDDPAMLTNVRYHLGLAWYTIGSFGRLHRESELWLAEARERKDRVAVALLTGIGHGFFRLLMRDQPDKALAELDETVTVVPSEPYSFVHFGHMIGSVMTLLYQGGPSALRWLDDRKDMLGRPLLLRTHMGQRGLRVITGLATLAACAGSGKDEQALLLRRARGYANKLLRDGAPYSRAFAHLFLAQIAALEDDKLRALEHAYAAHESANESEISVAPTTSYLIGLLESDANHPRCKQVIEFLREQGIRDPMRALLITLPSLAVLAPVRKAPKHAGQTVLAERYELGADLGGGGFGAVIEARDLHTDRTVALKELVSKAGRSLERFKQEFRVLQGIHHTHLLRLDALFEHAGTWYIAMELVEGDNLGDYFGHKGALSAARIRTVFAGIAQALTALHSAGFVHRDVSPDNVRVTPEGRAVVLDFGLIARIDDARDVQPTGSADYASPEQLEGALPSPSADVYGLGGCLYRVLTGGAPFIGDTPLAVVEEKRRGPPRPPPPSTDPHLDALAALSMRMLARVASERPPMAEVVTALSSSLLSRDRHPSLLAEHEKPAAFSGRERELARLDEVFEHTDEGLAIAFVEGESGLGKSALVQEFSQRVERRFPRLLALRGRCYENEQVALKAFDGAVDELARALRTLPTPECEALLPKRAALLSQLFPVLSSVPAIAEASRKGLPADPSARRRVAIEAFIKLLERLTETYELLIVIDDLQWADRESFQLLAQLLALRTQLPLMIVCTVRATAELGTAAREGLAPLRAHPAATNVVLEGLTNDAIAQLARELYDQDVPPARLARLIEESKGHPLFLRELIEQEKSGLSVSSSLTLDEALRARLASFGREARRLVSLVALADKPYGMHVLARAMHSTELPREALVALLSHGILRRRGDDELTCYHDRIRRVALAQLSPEQQRELAHDLASALDSELRADPAERARLWDQAGDGERAGIAYERAGESALEALSFARAEQHYARALTLMGERRDERWHRILVQHAHALVRSGRSAEAARDFAAAAEHAQGDAQVQLRTLAAQQLIQGAQVEAGLAATHALLAELDVPVPHSQGSALARLVWDRTALALRGLEVKQSKKPLTHTDRTRLDAAWSLALPLAWIDPLASAALSSRHLRMALASSELSHVARALAEESFNRAVQNPDDRQIDTLLGRARAIAATRRDPALEAVVAFREGTTYSYRWEINRAHERLAHALQIVTERCPEEAFLRTNVRTALGAVWANHCDHAQLAGAFPGWIAEAEDRGDQFALTMLTGLGLGVLQHAMRDRPDEGRAELDRHHAQWPREPVSFAHLGEMLGISYIELYRGGPSALAWFEREMPRLARSFLLRNALGRGSLLVFYGTAIVSAWLEAKPDERPLLRARLPAISKALGRLNSVFAKNMSVSIQMHEAIIDGDLDRGLTLTRSLRERSEQIDHTLVVWPARYMESLLSGGEGGQQVRKEAIDFYTAQGWQNPLRAISMFCPAIRILAARG